MSVLAPVSMTHRFRPRGTCRRLLQVRADEVLISGPAGTGKSRACLEKILIACLAKPKTRALFVRKTLASLGSTMLVTWREKVAQPYIEAGIIWFYGGSSEEAPQYRFGNGSTITIGGLDKPTKIMSSEYDLIYVQEAIELTEVDWESLTTRLRNGNLSYQQLLADCNPDMPTHWLNRRCEEGKTVMLTSTHEDNPVLFDEVPQPDGQVGYQVTEAGRSYIGKLDALTGVMKQRYRYGKWVAADGLIYAEYDPTIHLIDKFPIPWDWPRYWSIDFGYTNPFVCQWWAEDPDGRAYLYRELYMTKRLVEDHAETIAALVMKDPIRPVDRDGQVGAWRPENGEWLEPKPRAIICDHDAEDRATLSKHLGMGTVGAKKAVTLGIQAFESRLKVQKDGKPRLYLMRGVTVEKDQALLDAKYPISTVEEIVGYVWAKTPDGKPNKEEPEKRHDHGCDAGRYYVTHRDLATRPRVRMLG